MANNTTTTFDAALKQIYKPDNVRNTTYKMRPLFGLLPKFEGFGGRNMPVVQIHSNGMGRSATFADARTNTTAVQMQDFLLTRVSDYALAHIDSELIEATKGKAEAFVAALKTSIDSSMNALADSIESAIPRSGTGSIGVCGSTSTTTCTLSDINDVVNFELNMEVEASAVDGGALRSGSTTVTGVNRSTGVLTSDATWTTAITSFEATDFLFVQGDGAETASPTQSDYVKITGLSSWFPATAPSASESFFGVDRSTDSRMWGTYHDGSSSTVEDALIDAQSKASREGGKPDCAVLNHVQYRTLIKELGSKKEYSEVNAQGDKGSIANVGYRGVCIQGDHGPIDVIAANKCQSDIGYILQRDTLLLASLGPATKFLMEDGQRFLRRDSTDAMEVRLAFRGNLACKAPCYNAHVALASLT